MSKNTNKRRDKEYERKRIPLKRFASVAGLSENLWSEIGKMLGTQIDETTRSSIEGVTLLFAMSGAIQSDENTILESELWPALDAWRRATDELRRVLRLGVDPVEETFGRIDVIKPFLEDVIWPSQERDDWRIFGGMLPLQALALSVSSATAAARVASAELKGTAGRIKHDLWSAWACLVGTYLSRAKVDVSVSKNSKTESPYVNVIRSLQSHLPAGCQRFSESTDPYESVAIGIIRAHRALGKRSEKQLLLILGGWGTGILNGYQGPFETAGESKIAEFELQAERVFADIKRRRAESDP